MNDLNGIANGAAEPHRLDKGLSIQKIRPLLLFALGASVVLFTWSVYRLVTDITRTVGPSLREDLQWKALRGARELANTADLGVLTADAELVMKEFRAFQTSRDIQALVAVGANDKLVAESGDLPEPLENLFRGPELTVREGGDALIAWAPVVIEGEQLGKIAVAISLTRLREAEQQLAGVSTTTLVFGAIFLAMGLLFLNYFTQQVVVRDKALSAYANELEQRVAARTAELANRNDEMRLVLDNVDQGFITIDLKGAMFAERSKIVTAWFGPSGEGQLFSDYLRAHDPTGADWFDLGLDALNDGILPEEMCLEQMPKRVTVGPRTLEILYRPLRAAGTITRLMLVISDATMILQAERIEEERREIVTIFERFMRDRVGTLEFCADTDRLVDVLTNRDEQIDTSEEFQALHTLKGNSATFGLRGLAATCHEIETRMQEEHQRMDASDRNLLRGAWGSVRARVEPILDAESGIIEVDRKDYERLVGSLNRGASVEDALRQLHSWQLEPVLKRFERLGEKAVGAATRLGKGPLHVDVRDNDIRLDPHSWLSFWSVFIHVVRNAVDHGLEEREVRAERGKPPGGTLELAAELIGDELVLRIRDDGAGIDWDRVREKARAASLPHATQRDLVEALFSDGLTTRDEVSVFSGRGVGLGAVRAEVLKRKGRFDVQSQLGSGTTFEFRFPSRSAAPEVAA